MMRGNVTLRGVGADVTILRAAPSLADAPVASWTGDGWGLEELTIDGNRRGGASGETVVMMGDPGGAHLSRVRVRDGAQGIYADGDGHRLEDVQVDGMTEPAVVMNGSGCRIARLNASANRSLVVRIRDDSELVDSRIVTDPASMVVQIQLRGNRIACRRNRIDTSAIVPASSGPENATAIGTGAGCSDLLIAGNGHGGKAGGIFVGAFDQPGTPRNVRIVDNVLDGGAFDGILIGDGSSTAAENIVIGHNTVREIRIHGDPVYDYGVGIESHCDNVLIVGNSVHGTDGGGIFAVAGSNVSIVGNAVRNAGFANKAGAIEFTSRHTLISGNHVVDTGDPGKPKGNSRAIGSYGRYDPGTVPLDGLQIQGNRIVDHRSPAGVQYGIAMFAGDFGGTAALSGNVVQGIEIPSHLGPGWSVEGFPTDTKLLARKELTTTTTFAGTSYADVAGVSIAFVEPVGPYWLELQLPCVTTDGSGRLAVQVTTAANVVRLGRELTAPGVSGWRGSVAGRRLLIGGGEQVTLKLRAKVTGGSSWAVVDEHGPLQLLVLSV